MLYTVMLLSTLSVIETVKSTYKITCDTAYPVESDIVGMFLSAAAWTSLADNSCVSAAGVTVNRMVDSTVAYA